MTAADAADRLSAVRNLLLKFERFLKFERSDRLSKWDNEAVRTARKDLEKVATYLISLQPEEGWEVRGQSYGR